jgi:bacillithiol biosynthesis cysteine-adding enzyme BshC
MDWIPTHLSYRQTGYFSKIITDYVGQAPALAPYYAHAVSLEGMQASLQARQRSIVQREVLVGALREQYAGVPVSAAVEKNIEALLQDNTFTVCTAHQPALFTGTLYFIYKILHTVRLAESLSAQWRQYRFVPVFYMGSEDADLEELGKIYLDNEKLVWDAAGQTGAVGRMRPKGLEKILNRIEGELSVLPFGAELVRLLKAAYLDSPDIQTATFRLLHNLFADYGLVILIPDHTGLKRLMIPIFEEDLLQQTPSKVVDQSIEALSQHYKVQANPRPINLFYLKDDLRGRIERVGDVYKVHDSTLTFTQTEIIDELHRYPERFSPNVILRGLFQETILPNIAFIGGGGETAYWLELRSLFEHYSVPFPVLVLRNSFLLITAEWSQKMKRADLSVTDIFMREDELTNELVKKQSQHQLGLDGEIGTLQAYYDRIKGLASSVDPTLGQHVAALSVKALGPVRELEKKLLKAEKRKFADLQRQIHHLKSALFPLNGLQERIDNFMPWYAQRGRQFIADIYAHSLSLEQKFVVLTEKAD